MGDAIQRALARRRWPGGRAYATALLALCGIHCGTRAAPESGIPDASDAGVLDPLDARSIDDVAADDAATADAAGAAPDSTWRDEEPAPEPPSDAAADAPRVDVVPAPPLPYERPSYTRLSETGLFESSSGSGPQAIADALEFAPAHQLWSDAAAKRRWIRLPPGTSIDTTDMDHWVFPVGTKVWKQFSLGGTLLETRLIERYGNGPDDYWMGAFVWNDEQSDAVFAPDGEENLHGTAHDAPAQKLCGSCHRGEAGRVLGFSAIQLAPGPNVAPRPSLLELARDGWLSSAPGADVGLVGEGVSAAALGYLHANCAHCHNDRGTAWPDTQMVLRLRVAERDAQASEVYRSLVGVPLQYWRGGDVSQRVAPGHPEASGLVARMQTREAKVGMPPLATETPDEAGLALVRSWITSLQP